MGINDQENNRMDVKQQVMDFYNQVGWCEIGDGVYQNATHEDLRPVSRDYIHRCHMRVNRHIKNAGKYLLDAGSGPIQYPEYLEYSKGYEYRVCADISMIALQEARKRIGDHGLFVVADVANLPFRTGSFDGVVSLHTIHHLPLQEQAAGYQEIYRMLADGSSAVVVHGWGRSSFMMFFKRIFNFRQSVKRFLHLSQPLQKIGFEDDTEKQLSQQPGGTYVIKNDAAWLKQTLGKSMPLKIFTWRSVNVWFLRTFIREQWAGRSFLRLLFWLEECFPILFGKIGQYPLIVIGYKGKLKN